MTEDHHTEEEEEEEEEEDIEAISQFWSIVLIELINEFQIT